MGPADRGRRLSNLLVVLYICLAGCATLPSTPPAQLPVAVWDLEDLSPSLTPANPGAGEFLAAKVLAEVKAAGYPAVERQKLLSALEELRLGSSALVDETTRLRIGKVLGARLMIFGGFIKLGNTMRLDLRLVDVETGTTVRAVEKKSQAADFAAWLKAASEAATILMTPDR